MTATPRAASRTGTLVCFNSGGFLNLGAPELFVIGACAWALLGPKELFRLSREAGAFLSEWQALGQQAKSTFTEALESELAEDAATAAKEAGTSFTERAKEWAAPFAAENFGALATPAASSSSAAAEPLSEYRTLKQELERTSADAAVAEENLAAAQASAPTAGASIPPLSEYAAAREATPEQYAEYTAAQDAATFQEQLSGARNEAVLAEYPAELSAEEQRQEGPPRPAGWPEPAADAPADGSPLGLVSAESGLLDSAVAEAENRLAMLRAEQQVLLLKKQQMQRNFERAQQAAAAAAAAAEAAAMEATASTGEAMTTASGTTVRVRKAGEEKASPAAPPAGGAG